MKGGEKSERMKFIDFVWLCILAAQHNSGNFEYWMDV